MQEYRGLQLAGVHVGEAGGGRVGSGGAVEGVREPCPTSGRYWSASFFCFAVFRSVSGEVVSFNSSSCDLKCIDSKP